MKTLIAILLIFAVSTSFADDYWPRTEYKTLNQANAERELRKEYQMQQELMRELRDTGQINYKSPADVYNMREGGYGYDGGTRGYQPYQPYRYQPYSY